MYQNFDEKYVTINYDEGSSATLTQTTLAYWDKDYGKKLLTSEEQLSMYLKPTITPVVKYLMYDNMCKLVDAGAFIKCEKLEDALSNYKYNFYTKRNVRYTILFPVQFHNINAKYLESFEKLYRKQLVLLDEAKNQAKQPRISKETKAQEEIKKEISVVETFDIDGYKPKREEVKEEVNVVKVEPIIEKEEIKEPVIEEVQKPVIKEEVKPEIKEEVKEEPKKEVKDEFNKDSLSSILSSLDL